MCHLNSEIGSPNRFEFRWLSFCVTLWINHTDRRKYCFIYAINRCTKRPTKRGWNPITCGDCPNVSDYIFITQRFMCDLWAEVRINILNCEGGHRIIYRNVKTVLRSAAVISEVKRAWIVQNPVYSAYIDAAPWSCVTNRLFAWDLFEYSIFVIWYSNI